MIPRQPRFTLFPYTTLFRSNVNTAFTYKSGTIETNKGTFYGFGGNIRIQATSTGTAKARSVIFLDYERTGTDRKSTRLNSSHTVISYAVFCLKKKKKKKIIK